jgi:hypothetical protein
MILLDFLFEVVQRWRCRLKLLAAFSAHIHAYMLTDESTTATETVVCVAGLAPASSAEDVYMRQRLART